MHAETLPTYSTGKADKGAKEPMTSVQLSHDEQSGTTI